MGGPRIIGIVLSGCNGDGTAGLHAIKSCGGTAIVKEPAAAEEPVMPRSAGPVDRRVPLAVLVALVGGPAGPP